MIGDREAAIEIAIGDHFWNGDRDRNRDRDLNFGDRAHCLCSGGQKFLYPASNGYPDLNSIKGPLCCGP